MSKEVVAVAKNSMVIARESIGLAKESIGKKDREMQRQLMETILSQNVML